MEIKEAICTGNSRYKANQRLNPVGVVLHSIGCPQPDARVLQRSWQNNASPYVTHYILDDVRILHTMPDDRRCWHVGTPGNDKWLGIEMCEPKDIKYVSGAKFVTKDRDAARAYCKKTYANAVQLLAKICKEHNWNPLTAIHTHYEVTTKRLSKTDHVDPEHLWNGLGLGYSLEKLRKDVAAAMPGITASSTTNSSASSSGTPVCYQIRVTAKVLNVRKGPGTDHEIVSTVDHGEVYVIVAEKNGWGKLKSGVGWVNLSYTTKVNTSSESGTADPESYKVRITASVLNVRKGPSVDDDVATNVKRNEVYTIVDEKNGWGKLKSGVGWINLSYAKKV